MILIRFLLRTCRGLMGWTLFTSVIAGACNAALVGLVSSVLTRTTPVTSTLIWAFVALGVGKVVSNIVSQVVLARFSQGAIARLRRDLISKILSVPLRHLEEIGSPRILVGLTDDIFNITQALLAIPVVAVNVFILLGGAAYLGWLSWRILASVTVLIVLGGVGYRFMVQRAFHWLNYARAEEDRLFGYFRALTEGIKELKLHRNRRNAFYRNIHDTTEAYQRQNVAAETCFITAQNWNHLLYFALIGVILFVVPRFATFSRETLTGYVVTSLYLMGPLAGVMTSISLFGRASVALQKVQELGLSLAERSTESCSFGEPNAEHSFSELEFRGIVHSYHREAEDSHFVLGPIDLSFRPGELVFLVGGNGSGKSTLAKIIAGLYAPEAGEVRLDGCVVTDKNRDQYRQLFSAVFGDFYLFDNFLGLDSTNLHAQAEEYLTLLHLQHKVKIRNGALSTTAVSQGQRKRLALLTAYLEDRAFYLFDEWAADQDPQFKNIFYTQLLPELKARGKAVLVISHDDRYFYMADRIIKLDYGKLAHSPAPAAESGVLV